MHSPSLDGSQFRSKPNSTSQEGGTLIHSISSTLERVPPLGVLHHG